MRQASGVRRQAISNQHIKYLLSALLSFYFCLLSFFLSPVASSLLPGLTP
jgi:hypothetical protein